DAPADSIAVDPDDANILYLGTDIGAFVSLDGGANWDILGTNLPNVPVTKIRVFESGGTKLARVSTYGRGVWQLSLPVPPAADLSPATVDFDAAFGFTFVNELARLTATFANNSSSPITITSIATTGAFSQTNNCATSVAAFSDCQIQVQFNPTTPGKSTGLLTVIDSAGTHSVSLNGTGTFLSISGDPLALNASVGNPSSAPIVITNNAGTPATITNISSNSSAFAETDNCATPLVANNGTCTIMVSFNPSVAGNFSGMLSFVDGSSGATRTVPLSGSSSDFGLAIAGSGPSATVTAGQAAT